MHGMRVLSTVREPELCETYHVTQKISATLNGNISQITLIGIKKKRILPSKRKGLYLAFATISNFCAKPRILIITRIALYLTSLKLHIFVQLVSQHLKTSVDIRNHKHVQSTPFIVTVN